MTAQAGHAQAGHAQAGHAPPGRAPWAASRRRVVVTALAGAALLLALALAGLATLAQEPFSAAIGASGLPGARRAQAVLRDLPLPWKAPRPAYVPPPDAAVAAGSLQPPAELPAAPPAEVSPASPASEGLPGPAVAPAPPSFKLEGFRHQWQTWNNCGPATITMATSHFGRAETQAQAAPVLKPNPNDKNVGPDELVA
ncbi:MAG TPA: hypothetical protein VHS99_07435, partial [Chloroflexota bacterium]|nr:hypothetical protein [Chloroflexota bacterium]